MESSISLNDVTAVIMAKSPQPGVSKTRLVSPGLTAENASDVALAMLRCVVDRLGCFGRRFLAVTPDESGDLLLLRLGSPEVEVIGQGTGDLGERMERVWRVVAPDRPVAFFGMDSPDVPLDVLAAIPKALATNELALGPTPDGGYWTLAATSCHPEVLRGVDWGSEAVYDQSCRLAGQAGLTWTNLPEWPDVDTPGDFQALCARLIDRHGPTGSPELALMLLADRIMDILDRPRSSEASPP